MKSTLLSSETTEKYSQFTQDYIHDKRSFLETVSRAKIVANGNGNVTLNESEAWEKWDAFGELFYSEALAEIIRLQSVIASRNNLIERLIYAGNWLAIHYEVARLTKLRDHPSLRIKNWRELATKWKETK